MATKTVKHPQNLGFCQECGKISPAYHSERNGKVYLVKECPDCGATETLVSSDAGCYNEKRFMAGYEGEAEKTCSLRCHECKQHKAIMLVFLDVTNRCNMNCPICIANIPAMGFRFDPPIEYFEKIFDALSRLEPKPKIQLFGGEPTVREDLLDIINIAKKKYGLSARVVTNGLRLADEQYCKDLLATGTQLMFSFDGRSPKIYEDLRKHPKAYDMKVKALENIKKYRKSKITIMSCIGEGVNDEHLADLVDFCHEGSDYIAALDMIPLNPACGPEAVEVENATLEDVERMMTQAIPEIEFLPAGMLYQFSTLRSTFDVGRMTFGGAHPNCEIVSIMISDGARYHPAAKYLKRPLKAVAVEAVRLDREMGEKLKRSRMVRYLGHRGRQFLYGSAMLSFIRRNINAQEVFGDRVMAKVLQIAWGLIRGIKLKHLLRGHTKCQNILRLIVLPFEEKGCVEAARLVDCPAAFAYEHPETKEIRLIPVCAWGVYKNDILYETARHYGTDHSIDREVVADL